MAKVLVVDDEEGIRTFLADALSMDGHDVAMAADGAEASALLAAHSFTVVVTDLRMPNKDGAALLAEIKSEQPEVEVIVLTAHGTVQNAVDAMKQGAFDYVEKPLHSPAELRLLVTRAAERHALRSREEASQRGDGTTLTWGAPSMAPVSRAVERVAPTDATVLLLGESGTGKEVAARLLHRTSRRASGPFVAINCAALSRELLESELFGHEKGAFTGAVARHRGRLELAHGGTLFLDEVGELAHDLQAKLLRVLQERRFERVGGQQTVEVDVRIVAATNRDLEGAIAAGGFREDLYHRLAVFPIRIPPLRERREDIAPLARELVREIGAHLGRSGLALDDGALAALGRHPWPGNVRELRNCIERSAILAEGRLLGETDLDLPLVRGGSAGAAPTMEEAEREAIARALELHDGNRRRAAEHLGIGLRTLYDKLKKYGQ